MSNLKSINIFHSSFYYSLWISLLAASWLLPNHYYPWLAFHTDAWMSAVLLAAGFLVISRSKKLTPVHWAPILFAPLLFIPGIQVGVGYSLMIGTAWISTAYLVGFLLAMLIGAQWESYQPGQLVEGLFSAIFIASLISVGLQLQQWLEIDGIELLKMGGGSTRPHANLGQPNQLGTVLLWGLLATLLGYHKKHLNAGTATLVAIYLLFGLALTGSRTAMLGVVILLSCIWLWRSVWLSKKFAIVATLLAIYYYGCALSVGELGSLLRMDPLGAADILATASSQARFEAWKMLFDAALHQPLRGYGWSQTSAAQLAVASEHPSLNGVFSYSHNLFLDLILWVGAPLGLILVGVVLYLFFRLFKKIDSVQASILFLFLLLVLNHAMLEMPLYYGYILLPVGLVIGVLSIQLNEKPVFIIGRAPMMGLWCVAAVLLGLIVRDYLLIEESYRNVRYERLRIKVQRLEVPKVILLTQWKDYVEYERFEPKPGLKPERLIWMHGVVNQFPSSLFLYKYARTLALNDEPEKATLALINLCKISPAQECRDARTIWIKQSATVPIINTAWPAAALPR